MALSALALVGCTHAEPAAVAPAAPTLLPPSSTVNPEKAATAAALAAYRDMWAAYDVAIQVPNPSDPGLARYAAGTALHMVTTGLTSMRTEGLKGTGSIVVEPVVTEVSPAASPTQARIRDCMDTRASRIVRAGPGPVYSDSPGGRRLCLAVVQLQGDGSWKVVDFGIHEVGSCH